LRQSDTKNDKDLDELTADVELDYNQLPSGKLVGSVASAIKILRYLGENTGPVGVTKIAKCTQLNTSTVFNILHTLAVHDMVTFDPPKKVYSLSLGVFQIVGSATDIRGDFSVLRPHMEHLARQYGLTLTLWQTTSKNRKVLVYSALSRSDTRIQMTIGQRLPVYIGATGRVFAAFGATSDAELQLRFNEIRWDTPLTFDEFLQQVHDTRAKGWAMDDGNFAAGTISLAVPIFDASGVAIMAMTATMFAEQYDEERFQKVVVSLQKFSTRASKIAAH